MIKLKVKIFLAVWGVLLCTHQAAAQFLNIDFEIKPELSVTVFQQLDFGNLVANTGEHSILLGDMNMGVFEIKAMAAQHVYLTMTPPAFLSFLGGDSNNIIPIHLEAAFNNTNGDNPAAARKLEGDKGNVPVSEAGSSAAPTDANWRELYIYIYGSITVGNISGGAYTGDVTLSVVYN